MLAVGLISGTSADGVTAALVDIGNSSVQVLRCETYPYSKALRQSVLAAPQLKTPALSALNFALGAAFAEAALKVSRGRKPAVIGSHGQTVWHGPDEAPPNTLQLGEAAVIAERAGVTVVCDFRPRDIASGGQGAPLMPAFDEFLFAQGPLKALQNIGGIGNVAVVGRGRTWTAFDTGPGNGLMDQAVRLATSGRRHMDEDGRLAAKGKADERKVARLLRLEYFSRKPPKSLERLFFGESFLKKHFGRITERRLPDVLATLALFTARGVRDSYDRFIFPKHRLTELVLSGGGALNPVLVRRLWELFKPLPIVVSDKYGVPLMAKEAACFAWLAARAIKGLPNNCPAATGAKGPRILGKIVPA